jgi:hypothetical protein
MHAKMRSLYKCRVVIALILLLLVVLSPIGCGTSLLQNYRSSFQNTNEPKVNMLEWRFDLFNSKYQKVEMEDSEDNEPG